MTEELLKRRVRIESEEDIDNLVSRAVVNFKNDAPKVFDRREGDYMVFYSPDRFSTPEDKEKRIVIEDTFYLGYLCKAHGGIGVNHSERHTQRKLTSADGDYYQERKDDLVKLGLM